ncbi:hypothetical protein B0H14DRAFT_2568546 [Mycena olivaceomarginata]|nr:hypothetical protein B0H14DRAFT_2568546 [Mycena olivaceomarginata]
MVLEALKLFACSAAGSAPPSIEHPGNTLGYPDRTPNNTGESKKAPSKWLLQNDGSVITFANSCKQIWEGFAERGMCIKSNQNDFFSLKISKVLAVSRQIFARVEMSKWSNWVTPGVDLNVIVQ